MLRRVGTGVDIIPLVDITANSNPNSARHKEIMPNSKFFQVPHDPVLIQRIREYLALHADNPQFDVREMAEYLQQRHLEYSRRKRKPFYTVVKNSYEALMYQLSRIEPPSSTEEDDDDVIDESDLQPVNVTNVLNNGLMQLYKQQTSLKQGEPINITISSDDSQDETNNVQRDNKSNDSAPTKNSDDEVQTNVDIVEENSNTTENNESKTKENNALLKLRLMKNSIQTNASRKRKLPGPSVPTIGPLKKKRDVSVIEPEVRFKDVGGVDGILEDICKLLVHVKYPEIYRQIGISPPRGFLLHGPPGCGKTLLANAIAGELGVPLIKVASPELVAGVSGESEERIRGLFDQAVSSAPCVLFIDEVDAITPNRQQAQREMERRIVAQLLSCLDELGKHENGDRVLVIGATNRPDAIDPALRRAGRFDREVCMGIPDLQARARILRVLCAKLKLNPDFDFDYVATYSPGFVGADLMALVREAAMAAVNRVFQTLKDECVVEVLKVSSEDDVQVVDTADVKEISGDPVPSSSAVDFVGSSKPTDVPESTVNDAPGSIIDVSGDVAKSKNTVLEDLMSWLHDKAPLTPSQLSSIRIEMNDFEKALKCVQPSAKREGFATVPDVTWDDIGSLRDIREELQMAILAPVRHAKEFEALGISSPTGVLLCGPPGCGKTLLAKAIANEAGVNFISVKGPELLNMYVGESERAVRSCFQRARNSAPCVIFFDELDALCPKRSDNGENGATMRVVNQMLTEMDGVEGRRGVYLMAASNRPDIIDPAVLRPGRLDKILYVGLPTAADRVDILRTLTKNGTRPKLDSDVDLAIIGRSEQCSGYTGADLAALVREAGVQVLREYMGREDKESTELLVRAVHFGQAVGKIRPSISDRDQKHYEKLKKIYSVPQDSTSDEIEDVHMDDA